MNTCEKQLSSSLSLGGQNLGKTICEKIHFENDSHSITDALEWGL